MIRLIFCNSNKQIKIFFYVSVLLLFFTSISFAEQSLYWNQVNHADGYKIYCRPESANTYFTNQLNISNNTRCSIMSLVSAFNLKPDRKYFFAVSAYSSNPNIIDSTQSNEIAYSYDSANSNDNTNGDILETVVIDNLNNSSLIIKGNWKISGGENPYGENSFYTTEPDDSFTFKSPFSGNIRISLCWTYFYNRCLNVPVKIYDGRTLIDTFYINQREKKDCSQWNILGDYTFGNTPRIVITAENHPELLEGEFKYISICADAAKFERLY